MRQQTIKMFQEFIQLHYKGEIQNIDESFSQNIDLAIRNNLTNENQQEEQQQYVTQYIETQPKVIEEHLNYWSQSCSKWLNNGVYLWILPYFVLDKLNEGYFDLDSLEKNYGDYTFQVRQQIKDNFNSNYITLSLSNYIEYIKNKQSFLEKNQTIQKDSILTMQDIYIEEWEEYSNQLYEFIPTSLQKEDGFCYLKKKINKVNQLLLNILSKDSIIGGHQEADGANYFNINHGPGDCLWTVIDGENAERLFQTYPLLQKNEGNWYKEPQYFFEQKIPYKRFIQKPGDLIVLGAGSLFQIKALSYTITSGWSFVVLNDYTYQQMYNRTKTNMLNTIYQIKSIIPIRNLFLNIQIHHQSDLLRKFLEEFISDEITELSKCKQNTYSINLNYSVRKYTKCFECKDEIFLGCFFIKSKPHCTFCMKKYHNIQFQLKYNIQQLILLIKSTCQNKCSLNYCSKYVGPITQCEIQNTKKQEEIKSNETSILDINEHSEVQYNNEQQQYQYQEEEYYYKQKKVIKNKINTHKVKKVKKIKTQFDQINKTEKKVKLEPISITKITKHTYKQSVTQLKIEQDKIEKSQSQEKQSTDNSQIQKEEVKEQNITQEKQDIKNQIKIESQLQNKQEINQQENQIQKPQNQNENNIITIQDEPANIQSYPILTRQRQQIKTQISPKEETKEDIKKKKKSQKKQQVYNKLSEEEVRKQLEVSEQQEIRILKKGEQILTL